MTIGLLTLSLGLTLSTWGLLLLGRGDDVGLSRLVRRGRIWQGVGVVLVWVGTLVVVAAGGGV